MNRDLPSLYLQTLRLPLLVLALLLSRSVSFPTECHAQENPVSIPSATEEMPPAIPYEVEGRSELDPQKSFTGDLFHYSLILSWEGAQAWVNLDPPKVEWPEEVEQVDVRTKSVSRLGSSGPIGEKLFIYDLRSTTPGTYTLPKIEVEILFQDSSTQKVEILGKEVNVEIPPTPPGTKLINRIRDNIWVVGGVLALILVAVVLSILNLRKNSPETGERPDPWIPIEESLERCEALQKAGRAREFYECVEATLGAACALSAGKQQRQLRDFPLVEKMEPSLQQDFKTLIGEIEERKYRPDQPRPEEMQRTYKQARSVLVFLQRKFQERGS